MFIVPFIHNCIDQNILKINIIKILTIGGKNLWEETNSLHIDKDILNPNDIYKKNKPIKLDKKTLLCEIDQTKTQISDFYKWEEIELDNNDIFCWKTFIYLTGNNDTTWLDIPDSEKIGPYLVKDIIKKIMKKNKK
jgi:hypothetical protein